MTMTYLPSVTSDMTEVLNAHKLEVMRGINCCLVGKIAAFDKTTNTAKVRIQMQRQYANMDTPLDFPLLSDCPVVTMFGGNSFLSMPIQVDDPCLVLFHDRDLDNWWYSGQATTPNSNRVHSLSDGICLVGIRPLSSPIPLESNPGIFSLDSKVQMKGVGAGIDATLGTVEIKNALFGMKALMDELFTAIDGILTTNAVVGSPCSLSPATKLVFSTLKAKFDQLLG